jgi:hypothetical protein
LFVNHVAVGVALNEDELLLDEDSELLELELDDD